jgi:ABC-type transporter Mla subunit MlaD
MYTQRLYIPIMVHLVQNANYELRACTRNLQVFENMLLRTHSRLEQIERGVPWLRALFNSGKNVVNSSTSAVFTSSMLSSVDQVSVAMLCCVQGGCVFEGITIVITEP